MLLKQAVLPYSYHARVCTTECSKGTLKWKDSLPLGSSKEKKASVNIVEAMGSLVQSPYVNSTIC